MKNAFAIILCLLLFCSCNEKEGENSESRIEFISSAQNYEVVVVGVAQDAGYPQINCQKECCREVWEDKNKRKMVSSLALIDRNANKYWLFDATPDIKDQIRLVQELTEWNFMPEGVFLTHAHMGHYTGLMHLGYEAINSKGVNVYVMPRFATYLKNNGPWSQLVDFGNIEIQEMISDSSVVLSDSLSVIPFLVPHRDEFSETVGFVIEGPRKKTMFIPDIDKWELWERDIRKEIMDLDYAFVDGTFYKNGEIPGRDMSQIPHPFIEESMNLLSDLPAVEKSKVYFIHLNHTNPLLQESSEAYSEFSKSGFYLAREGMRLGL